MKHFKGQLDASNRRLRQGVSGIGRKGDSVAAKLVRLGCQTALGHSRLTLGELCDARPWCFTSPSGDPVRLAEVAYCI